MKYTILIVAALSAALPYTGCNSRSRNSAATSQTSVDAARSSAVTQTGNDVIKDDTVRMQIVNGHGRLTLTKKERQTVVVVFKADRPAKLQGKLIPEDSTANIRFSQITLADGSMDGPFGRTIEYDLSTAGEYKLSVHESLMAGDPWAGKFEVDIALKDAGR